MSERDSNDEDIEPTLADEIESRIEDAIAGDIANVESIKDAFLSSDSTGADLDE